MFLTIRLTANTTKTQTFQACRCDISSVYIQYIQVYIQYIYILFFLLGNFAVFDQRIFLIASALPVAVNVGLLKTVVLLVPNSSCLGISAAPAFLSPDKRMSWIDRRSRGDPKRQQPTKGLLSSYNSCCCFKTRGGGNRLIGRRWDVCDGGTAQGLEMLFIVIPQTGPRCGLKRFLFEAKALNLISLALSWLPSFDGIVASPRFSLYLHLHPPLCHLSQALTPSQQPFS